MINDLLSGLLREAVNSAHRDGSLTIDADGVDITLDAPKSKDHGDFASNIAMMLQKRAGKPAREIAQIIVDRLPIGEGLIRRVDIAGPGFMNFFLSTDWLHDVLVTIETEDYKYGCSSSRSGERTLIEFVSANPTGPISVVNARAAEVGDVLGNLLTACGAYVEREFYVNDAVNSTQIDLLGQSIACRYLQLFGVDAEIPENGYNGEYLIEIAKEIADQEGDRYVTFTEDERNAVFRDLAAPKMVEQQQRDLAAFGLEYNTWFFESKLYETGEVAAAVSLMKESGHAYEKEDALWLRSTALSTDDQDRVLVRSNGKETYVAADAAYHKNKFDRGFNRLINIWGADHHGYVQRLKAGVAALGYDPGKLEIILTQLVMLMRNGEPVKGSKRAGDIIPLADVVNEVGRDATRYYCLLNSYETNAVFDLELAKKQSSDNPVFYAQYAHARCCNVLRKAGELNVSLVPAEQCDRTKLSHTRELDLLKKLSEYPQEVRTAADMLAPHRLTAYVREVGQALHQYYEECPALKEGVDPAVRDARLALFNVTRIVARNLLTMLCVSAPEKM